MLKISVIVLLILIALVGIFKSTISHKVGYGLFILYFMSCVIEPIRINLEAMLQNHKAIARFYESYLLYILLTYCGIGILEGLIRIFAEDFSFYDFIVESHNSIKSKKELKKIGRLPGQIDIYAVFPQLQHSFEYECIFNQCENSNEKKQFDIDWNEYILDLQSHVFLNKDRKAEDLFIDFDTWFKAEERWKVTSYYHKYYKELKQIQESKSTESKKAENSLKYSNIVYSDSAITIENILQELDKMVGLANVKKEIYELVQLEKFQQQRKSQGLKSNNGNSYHLAFVGNPGTGKTTVARMVAGIYYKLGIVSKGQFVEVDRAGLVGEYLGQTAIKTTEVINSAIGGVLFIDEAYSLIHSGIRGGDAYGKEALDTLLKAMEDYRNDLVIIMAGYTNEMDEFIAVNPGLKSRFKKKIQFDDYTPEELNAIFHLYVADNDNIVSEEAEEELKHIFDNMYEKRDAKFGNGRDIRNIYDSIVQQMGVRASQLQLPSRRELQTITKDDVLNAIQNDNKERKINTSSVHLKTYINEFSLRKKIWDSDLEKKVYSTLKRVINNDFIIMPHVAFREVFSWEWEKNWSLTNRVTKCHFDFGIFDKEFCPVLFIESWGKDHKEKLKVKEIDIFKQELMNKKGNAKLVIIDATESMSDVELEEKVIACIKSEIPSRDSYPTYCNMQAYFIYLNVYSYILIRPYIVND